MTTFVLDRSVRGKLAQHVKHLYAAWTACDIRRDGDVRLLTQNLIRQTCQHAARADFYKDARACRIHLLNLFDELDWTDQVFRQHVGYFLRVIRVRSRQGIGKHRQPRRVQSSRSENVGKPLFSRSHDRRVKRARDRGQADVDDRGVERGHERSQPDERQNLPPANNHHQGDHNPQSIAAALSLAISSSTAIRW